jgi:hypothetical protein
MGVNNNLENELSVKSCTITLLYGFPIFMSYSRGFQLARLQGPNLKYLMWLRAM